MNRSAPEPAGSSFRWTRSGLSRIPVLAALALLAGCTAGAAGDVPAGPPPAPEVSVAQVIMRDVRGWSDFTGRIEPAEQVDVRARVPGFVESVHFEEGGTVAQGDLLLRIDPRPLRAEVERLAAERQRTLAQLELARSYHARAQRMFTQNAISREELESMAADAAVAQAALAAVDAALSAAELDLSFTRVTAPIAGRVSRAIVTAGNLVDSSTLLTTIVAEDPVHVYFDADEHVYLERVRDSAFNKAPVYVGLINEQGYPHEARLDFVDNRVDSGNGTIRARAVLPNPGGRFTPGLFARVRVVGAGSRRRALVEDRAIGTDFGRRYVLVVGADDVAQYRAVETGPLLDDLRVVSSGLEPGEWVVVNGLQRVRPGTAVAPVRVAMGEDALARDRLVASRGATGPPER